MTAIAKRKKEPKQKVFKLFKRGSNSKQASITIPVPYGKDKNGNIIDDLNKIEIIPNPDQSRGMGFVITIYELKDEDAYREFCGKELDPDKIQNFIDKYPERAKNLRLRIATPNNIILFDDSEFIGKTTQELMRLMGRKYALDDQMQVRIHKIRDIMIANDMKYYNPNAMPADWDK